MKQVLLTLLTLSFIFIGRAQNVGIGTVTPNSSAKLDIQATNAGILIPRMTSAQRTSITTPATGLLVFDNTTSSFWYYGGSGWVELVSDSSLELVDADGDTKVQVEESTDEDIIRFDLAGTEHFVMDGSRLEVLNNGASIFVGSNAGLNDDLTNNFNVFVGASAGQLNISGSDNTFIGQGAGTQSTGDDNTFVGRWAGTLNTTGSYNVSIGAYAGLNNTTANNNSFLGQYAGYYNTTGSQNTFLGRGTGLNNTTGGANTFIGYNADASTNNLTNATAIGANATVTASNSMVLGDNNVKVGLGISNPQEKLHVIGGIRLGITTNTVAGNIRWTGSDFEGYDGSAWRSFTADESILEDDDADTKIQVEESVDEDMIRFDLAGTEHFVMNGPHLGIFSSGGSVFLGEGAGANDDLSANQNVFIGYNSGNANTDGFNNIGIGHSALDANTSGASNVALGGNSLTSNTIGNENVAVGYEVLYNNTTAEANVGIGYKALRSQSFSNGGTAYVTGNTAVGYYSLYWNNPNTPTMGIYNTAIGYRASNSNSTGSKNTAVGANALYHNSSGDENTVVGFEANRMQTHGNRNTSVGYQANFLATFGNDNTAIGHDALSQNYAGNHNTAVGISSLSTSGNVDGNTALGGFSGDSYANGSENTFIGYYADAAAASYTNATAIGARAIVGASNSIVLGSINGLNGATSNVNVGIGDATPDNTFTVGDGDKFQVDGTNGDVIFTDDQASITFPATNGTPTPMIQMFGSGSNNSDRMVLAHSSTFANYGLQYQDVYDKFHFIGGGAYILTIELASGEIGINTNTPGYDLHLANNSAAKPTSNTWTVPSDARLKKDVHDYQGGLSEILNIRPVTYTYTGEAGLPQETGVGIIAQELKEIAPYMVSTWTYEGEGSDRQEYYAVDNGAMTYMLINAIKEQQQMIQLLQKQVLELLDK